MKTSMWMKEQDENFQLTLKDLYELEKVKDIKTRDKILREATSSRDLVSRAQAAVAEAKRNENAKKLKEIIHPFRPPQLPCKLSDNSPAASL